MSPGEVARRARDEVRRQAWRRRQVRDGHAHVPSPPRRAVRSFMLRLPPASALDVPEDSRRALIEAADGIAGGRGTVLAAPRGDLDAPDWFRDPGTGRRAPQDRFSFSIDPRSEEQVGNIKEIWELSRHHHLTVLAAARFVTGEDRYAEVVARQLRSWWRENPFLCGVHWTSGIELGIRLISWVWIRRLLDGWPGAPGLFENNDAALEQVHWHQQYLAAFPSTGSSANNHVIAEAAGQLIASCAFPWFPESTRWRASAAELLERELAHNTFPSGVNRELASEYHCFVTELG
ncbi:MAG: heparinase, partial [Actinomycetota bacterium]|nr:heparinase [Actinomycetota bacterium]